MEKVGLRWDWTFQSWIGSQPEVKLQIEEYNIASRKCRDEMDLANP